MVAVSESSTTGEPRRTPKPRTAPDKEAVREHLDAFRQVANVSARTAVAKHTSKTLRMAMIIKGLVALMCAVASAVFFYQWIIEQQPYFPQAAGCLIMAALVGGTLVQNLLQLSKTSKLRWSASRPGGASRTVPPNADPTASPVESPLFEVTEDLPPGNSAGSSK
jgi:hypothetical protein